MLEKLKKFFKFLNDYKETLGGSFIIIVVLIVLCLIVIEIYHSWPDKANCAEEKITKVGGCDRNGLCSVELESGQTAFTYYPVQGHKSVVCKCKDNTYIEDVRRSLFNNKYIIFGDCYPHLKESK